MDATSSEPGGVRAADVFTAELRPRPGGRLAHAVRIAWAFLSEQLLQLLPTPAVHDVVVTRRDDGSEVLRVPAALPLLDGEALAQMRAELDRLDPESFLREWSAQAQTGR